MERHMKSSFGPWTTAMSAAPDVHGGARLSTFWIQRMSMLINVSKSPSGLTRRTATLLIAASVLACALPTLQILPASAESDGTQASEAKSTSRIFTTVYVRKENSFEKMLITVDPTTGRWQRFGDGERLHSIRISPDKQTLIFAKLDDGIWLCGAQEESEHKRVMYSGWKPVWSPDGKQIIAHEGKYEEDKGWKHSNWRINIDGTEL